MYHWVCTRNIEDFWAWYPEKKGNFTVSSAYKFLQQTKMQREEWLEGQGGSSSSDRDEKSWSMLWKIKVPSKIRIFLWRLAHHSLPTTDILNERNMSTRDACPLCGCEDSWRHALVACTMSRCVWALTEDTIVSSMIENEEADARIWLF